MTCRLDELRHHPSYVGHDLSVPATQLSTLRALGDFAFQHPIVITRNRTVIDGYARWKMAKDQGLATISCIEYELTEAEALRWLILSHRPSRGLNAFSRIVLALDLEPSLREQARANQQAGGRTKSSSDLTKAQKLNVRLAIAATAGVSTGNVAKVKRLVETACPEVKQAVRAGEISIHKAWGWGLLSARQQLTALEEDRKRRGTNHRSRQLIRRHVSKLVPKRLIPSTLGNLLEPLVATRWSVLHSIAVAEIDTPGNIVFLAAGALKILNSLENESDSYSPEHSEADLGSDAGNMGSTRDPARSS